MARRVIYLIAAFILLTYMSVAVAGVIQLPKTGQIKCWDSAGAEIACEHTGQDGEIQAGAAWPDPRFVVGAGAEVDCITDNLTGLMWARDANLLKGYLGWDNAVGYGKYISLCGYSDWRLPNINELESLINVNEPDNAAWLTSNGFINVQTSFNHYWSSTTSASYADDAWIANAWLGYLIDDYKPSYGYFNCWWPVRSSAAPVSPLWRTGQTVSYHSWDDGYFQNGVSWPIPRFTSSGGVAIDKLTGLMWTRDADTPGPKQCNPGSYKSWQGALDHVKCLNDSAYLGYTDWRLPNRKELLSLVDRSRYNPALPSGHPFLNVHSDVYWSSTSGAFFTDAAWVVNMWGGFLGHFEKIASAGVWSVRPNTLILSVSKTGSGSGEVTSSPPGIDCGSVCTGTFVEGNTVTLTAQPANEWSLFSKWSGCKTFKGNVCTTTMATNQKVTAAFIPTPTYQLTVTKGSTNGGKGIITSEDLSITCGTDCKEKYLKNTVITLTAVADTGSVFKGWQAPCTGSDSCVVPMNKATSVRGIFVGDYTLKVVNKGQKVNNVSGSGVVKYAPAAINCTTGSTLNCSGKVPYHASVKLTATPDLNSTLKAWVGCPAPSGLTCSLTMDKTFTVTATFMPVVNGGGEGQ